MHCAGKTDVGRKRKNNQDTFRIQTTRQYTLAVVCDGMGGAKGGSTASSLAAVTYMKSVKTGISTAGFENLTSGDFERILLSAVNEANRAVYDKSLSDSRLEGMGTTLVSFLMTEDFTVVVNVGDSRLYTFDGEQLKQVTCDHSFVQYLIDNGSITPEAALSHPNRNIILKAIGVNEYIEGDVFHLGGYQDLLMCTDGLTNMVPDSRIEEILLCDTDCISKANILIDIANDNGGVDNITVVLLCGREQS